LTIAGQPWHILAMMTNDQDAVAGVGKKRRQVLGPELVVALAAIVISLFTLGVLVYQSGIMREQQRVSVWPHLEWMPSWNPAYLHVDVTNKGVGPALVKRAILRLDDRELTGFAEVLAQLPAAAGRSFTYATVENRVLAAGESIRAFAVEDSVTVAALLAFLETHQLDFEICYCSIYGDCWTSFGSRVEEGGCP
jgi:hypothetical protein